MTSFDDPEFGEIRIQKRKGSRVVRIRVGTDGRYIATAPTYTPLFFIKQVVNSSREELRKLASHTSIENPYVDGQPVGQYHTLAVVPTQIVKEPATKVQRNRLLVYLPPGFALEDTQVQQKIRNSAIAILRKEAKAYLPSRLKELAIRHDFHYERVRFSHASSRWGSCSSNGTISLNIALMKLAPELIDYVLIHELCHTRHMNHSTAFWTEVGRYDPHYRTHRQRIKRETPTV